MTGQDDWTSRSLHLSSFAVRDRPGRLDFVRPRLWDLVPGVFDSTVSLHPFLGPVLCLGVTSHHPQHRGDPPENRMTEKPENRSRRAGVTEWSNGVLDRLDVTPNRMRTVPIRDPLWKHGPLSEPLCCVD